MGLTENGLANECGSADEHWLQRWWRPAMAWQYFLVCLCDFIVFPVFNAVFYAVWEKPYHEWHPLTLQGGGLYHMAMGAIIGVAAYQRTQEKMASLGFNGQPFVSERTDDKVAPAQPQRSSRAD
jgi:hypothetical protein